ncbi:MAG: substrate-binding domain-containing protein [Bradyrhizobiaceae bacterium]|nr:substrate-binding domain-containing protein [Bradyrhizobiaceae bacterium]
MSKLRLVLAIGAIAPVFLLAAGVFARAQQQSESGDLSIELIDPKVLRVCADPRNMPFSNEKGEGFENKIADLFAGKLGKSIGYTFYPQAPGFVRNTLGAYKCDVIIGYPQGNDIVQSTNPYYRTAYALVSRPGTGFDDIDTLADPRLKSKRIGIVAGTPPATLLAVNGLMATAKPYPLVIDTRVDSSAEAMMKDLAAGEIDVAVLWGPMAGYYAMKATPPMKVVPLTNERSGPRLAYYITMGVRGADQEWKRELNRLIAENQPEINAILTSFGVPLLDDKNQPIGEAPARRQ